MSHPCELGLLFHRHPVDLDDPASACKKLSHAHPLVYSVAIRKKKANSSDRKSVV